MGILSDSKKALYDNYTQEELDAMSVQERLDAWAGGFKKRMDSGSRYGDTVNKIGKAAAIGGVALAGGAALGGMGSLGGVGKTLGTKAASGFAGLSGAQLLGGAAMIGSNLYGASQAGKAADKQARAYDRATQAQVDMFNQGQEATAPWRESGGKALTQYERLLGLRGGGNQEKAYDQFRNTPGYQFQQDEMMRMLEGTSAAGGTFGSGQMAKDLMKYGGNLADQSYNSYADRLSNMSRVGANAATNSASQMQALGQSMGQNAIGAGQAQAAGQINRANLMTNMMNQGAQAYGMWGGRPQGQVQPQSTSFMMPMNQPSVSYN